MGPTNVALVKLYKADKALREAQSNLESASRSVRALERRVRELKERIDAAQAQLRQQQARYGELDLDIKSRDAHIEKLRDQQQNSKNHKEYQTFLTEINTEKIDKSKIEDEALKVMESLETQQKEIASLTAQEQSESKKLEETRQQLGARLASLQAEVDRLSPERDEAASGVEAKALAMFDRLADRYESEAMAAVTRPDRRLEEYVCGACHMSLVVNIYNRLHNRNEVVTCPNCHRLLYIPEELTVDAAINKRTSRSPRGRDRDKAAAAVAATSGRQTSAFDVMRSIEPDSDESAEATEPMESTDSPESPDAVDASGAESEIKPEAPQENSERQPPASPEGGSAT